MGAARDSAAGFAAGMDEVSGSAGNASGPLETITEQVGALAAAYQESYDEALKAIQGQYALWDEAEKVAPSDLSGVEKAMESQIANWTARTENLDLLSQYVGDVSGLYTLIGELSRDNSQESTNLLAGLAGAAKQEDLDTLREFADVYVQKLESEKKAAETAVELLPQWEEMSRGILERIDETVEGMDKSEASRAAGRAIIQAFMDEADDPSNLAAIRTAFGRAASEALRSLNARGGVTQEFLFQIGAEHYTPNSSPNAPKYTHAEWAEGGILTRPHIGLVAEDGPEAVIPLSGKRRDRGLELWREAGERLGALLPAGESVWNARDTAAALGNAPRYEAALAAPHTAVPVSVQIAVNVQGNASQDTVDALQDRAAEIAGMVTDQVMDRIHEEQIDAVRRSFST